MITRTIKNGIIKKINSMIEISRRFMVLIMWFTFTIINKADPRITICTVADFRLSTVTNKSTNSPLCTYVDLQDIDKLVIVFKYIYI